MRTGIFLSLLSFLSLPFSVEAQELRTPVFVELPEGHEAPVAATLHWSHFLESKGKLLQEAKPVEVPTHGTFAGALGRIAHIQVLAPGYWSAPATLGVSADPIYIRLVPTGRVTGTLRLPPGEAAPPEVTVHFQAVTAGKGEAPPVAGSVPCPVEAVRTFQCEIPAGALALEFQAEGYAPFPKASTTVPEGAEVAVGMVILQRERLPPEPERP